MNNPVKPYHIPIMNPINPLTFASLIGLIITPLKASHIIAIKFLRPITIPSLKFFMCLFYLFYLSCIY